MVQQIVEAFGGFREKRAPVHHVGFYEEPGNVMTAFAEDGSALFDFAYRPHFIGDKDYTEHGLFLC